MSAVTVSVVRSTPRSADAVGVAVGPSGPVPRQVGLNRAALEAHGFTGKVGSTLVVPSSGAATIVAVGVGDAPTDAQLREAAAAFTGLPASAPISPPTSPTPAGSTPQPRPAW